MKKQNGSSLILRAAMILLAAFAVWTVMILLVDVRPVGQNGTNVGLAGINVWFHQLTGEHMGLYDLTETNRLGLVPILVCLCMGGYALAQGVRRRSLWKIDADLILLGVYYAAVILCYLFFELVHVNYRPILIEGALEGSYPSSTTLLVLSVMPTLSFQVGRRCKNPAVRAAVGWAVAAFSALVVIFRLVAGVHWLTDIIGGVLLSAGLFLLYLAAVDAADARGARGAKNL